MEDAADAYNYFFMFFLPTQLVLVVAAEVTIAQSKPR